MRHARTGLRRSIRLLMLLVLGAILLLRVGPICAVTAEAASPATGLDMPGMAGHCDHQPARPVSKKTAGEACVTGCIALPAHLESIGPTLTLAATDRWLSVDTSLRGVSSKPAPPPPRTMA